MKLGQRVQDPFDSPHYTYLVQIKGHKGHNGQLPWLDLPDLPNNCEWFDESNLEVQA